MQTFTLTETKVDDTEIDLLYNWSYGILCPQAEDFTTQRPNAPGAVIDYYYQWLYIRPACRRFIVTLHFQRDSDRIFLGRSMYRDVRIEKHGINI